MLQPADNKNKLYMIYADEQSLDYFIQKLKYSMKLNAKKPSAFHHWSIVLVCDRCNTL